MNQPAEDALGGEPLEVRARLAQPLADTLDLSNLEPPADQCVQVDTAGDQVASRCGIAEPTIFGKHQLIEDFRLDEGQVVAISATTGRCERAGLGCVPISSQT